MDGLQKLIVEEFGNRILELPDTLSRGWTLPLTDDSLAEITPYLESVLNIDRIREIGRLAKQIHSEGKENRNMDDVSLAARLCTHDFRGRFGIYQSNVVDMIENPKYQTKLGEVKDLLEISVLQRAIGLSMAYLASGGDSRYIMQIPTSQMFYFFSGADISVASVASITNVHSTGLLQFYRNARTRQDIQIIKENGYVLASVADEGNGIIDKDEKPIPRNEIGKIFGNYTTKNKGGTGLIVARRLSELLGGYIELVTTTSCNPTFGYSTKTEEPFEGAQQSKSGTKFTLFSPINE